MPVDVRAMDRPIARAVLLLASSALALGACHGTPPPAPSNVRLATPVEPPLIPRGPSTARRIAVGGRHSCVIRKDGTVACWGNNEHGQLGNGSSVSSASPVEVPGVESAIQIDAHEDDTCVVRADGTIVCWGTEGPPRPVPDIAGAVQVSRHFFGLCAVLRTGKVDCRRPYLPVDPESAAPEIPGIDDAVEVRGSCVLRSSGEVSCWDRSSPGGNAVVPIRSSRPGERHYAVAPEPVGIDDAIGISGSGSTACALRRTGEVRCWGRPRIGELGDWGGRMSPEAFRTREPKVCDETVALASGGEWNECAVCRDGTSVCWGGRAYGKLEDNHGPPPSSFVGHANPTTPERVGALEQATEVAAGSFHACAITATSAVVCWGENGDGQLGGGFLPRERGVASVQGISDAVRVVSSGEFSCALRRGGTVSCWGSNRSGQLGDGTWTSRGEARAVHDLDSATSIAVARDHACATRSDGKVVCWGSEVPALPAIDALAFTSLTPKVMAKVENAVEVATGGAFICARTGKGRVECWGTDMFGTLAATPIPGLEDAREIATGGFGGCALRRSGKLLCWGAGSLGPWAPGPPGMTYPSQSLTKPRELRGVTDIASARVTGCFVRKSGRVQCFQNDGAYVLPENAVAVDVLGVVDAKSMVGGGIIVRASGDLARMEVENGRWVAKPFLPEIHDVVDASPECAVRATGAVVCWGDDDHYGQLGAGTKARSEVIVHVVGLP